MKQCSYDDIQLNRLLNEEAWRPATTKMKRTCCTARELQQTTFVSQMSPLQNLPGFSPRARQRTRGNQQVEYTLLRPQIPEKRLQNMRYPTVHATRTKRTSISIFTCKVVFALDAP